MNWVRISPGYVRQGKHLYQRDYFRSEKEEIDERLEEIIRFSELEEYIDNPVRTYSSGMYMRLAFAVAINVNADVLLIDEILAVGDVSFQKKCFERLKEIKEQEQPLLLYHIPWSSYTASVTV